MTEISTMLLIFLVEGLVALLLIVTVWSFLVYRRNRRDKAAVDSLVQEIRDQSSTRRQNITDFLQEKYGLQGDDLDSVLNNIDKAEKTYLQHLMNTYLNRDSQGIADMDDNLAELIGVYKELAPPFSQPQPQSQSEEDQDSVALVEEEDSEDIQLLEQKNADLQEQLEASRDAMTEMIEEFENLFESESKHELPQKEFMEKLNRYKEGTSSQRFNVAPMDEVRLDVDVDEEDDGQINNGNEQSEKIDPREHKAVVKKPEETHKKAGSGSEGLRSGMGHKDKNNTDKKDADKKDVEIEDQNEIDDLLDSIDLSSDNLRSR